MRALVGRAKVATCGRRPSDDVGQKRQLTEAIPIAVALSSVSIFITNGSTAMCHNERLIEALLAEKVLDGRCIIPKYLRPIYLWI